MSFLIDGEGMSCGDGLENMDRSMSGRVPGMEGSPDPESGRGGRSRNPRQGERGVAALEFALIVPLLVVLAFAVVDFGRLFHARLIVTNVSREGGSLASRGFKSGNDLIAMLQSSGSPLDLNADGRIYLTRVQRGTRDEDPAIAERFSRGNLSVPSGIDARLATLGLSPAVYGHLVFEPAQNTSDITGVTVVEVFYLYRPLTPLPHFIQGILLPDGGGMIIRSRAVFQSVES
ncbi:MAG: TadE family protein [Syntrophales bacterium]